MKTILVIIVVLLVGFGLYYFTMGKGNPSQVYNTPSTYTTPATSTTTVPTSTSTEMVRVSEPLDNALVKSPVVVKGTARGNWYFEASFPIKVLDGNGKVLGTAPAQAQGDWMTTNFVPFSLSLPFASSTTATGTIVLQKDNPSGLPANDAEIRIPVRFR